MKNPEKTLGALHEALAQELLQRVRSGEAKPADLSVARQFLNDNEISAHDAPTLGQLRTVLTQDLPIPDVDDTYPN